MRSAPGLVGESEPLRKYGVRLSETRVQQEALAQTRQDNVKQLTDQEKVHARIAMIFKDSTQAQGDFAAHLGRRRATRSRSSTRNVENLKADLGREADPRPDRASSPG